MRSAKKCAVKWKTVLWVLLGLAAILAVILIAGREKGPEGVLIPQVMDGDTDRPIEGCTVVVPETGARLMTDAEGKTPELKLPAGCCGTVKGIPQKQWNEVTLLVYKEGYIPYALFYVQVWQDVTREGPKIYIFPDDGSTDGRAYSIIEGPDRGWVEDLVEKYAPEGRGAEVTQSGNDAPAEDDAPDINEEK